MMNAYFTIAATKRNKRVLPQAPPRGGVWHRPRRGTKRPIQRQGKTRNDVFIHNDRAEIPRGLGGGLDKLEGFAPQGRAANGVAASQPIQWSSEFTDTDLGLVYYNYRHYNPLDGRWTGRDFIQKTENKNPYLFIFNKLPFDIFGLFMSAGCCAVGPENFGLMPQCPKRAKTRESGYFDFSLPSYHCAGKQYEYRTNKQKEGYHPTSNGCGAEGGTKFPGNFYLFDITPACNAHDICYGTCGNNKYQRDLKFYKDIPDICTSSIGFISLCRHLASIYSGAVLGWANSAYEAAQDEACEWAPCTM